MKTSKKQLSIATALALSMVGFALSAHAGRISLTGHDDDFHQSTLAKAQVLGMLNYVENGSLLPVLSFDHGSELTSLLTSLGVSYTNVDPNSAFSTSIFDPTLYSAIIVASDTSCGGCDNNSISSANLAADSSYFASFFNAGGGIVGLAGASNSSYYNFLPLSASNPGIVTNSYAFSQTAAGVADGIGAVNGDFPHNYFAFPGSGTDPAFHADEVYNGTDSLGQTLVNQPFTISAAGTVACSGGGCTIGGTVPEPASLALLGVGLVGLAAIRRRKLMV